MGQKQPRRAVHLLLLIFVLVHGFLLGLTWLLSLIVKHLGERSCLLSKLSLEALDYFQHAFAQEKEVKIWIFPPDYVEDLLPCESPTCNCGELAVIKISWTRDNPGRRFYGCPKFLHEINI